MDTTQIMEQTAAVSGLIYIIIVVVCIGFSWWGLQQVKFDLFLRKPKSPAGLLLQIFLSIALGSEIARFIVEYFNWSTLLKGMI